MIDLAVTKREHLSIRRRENDSDWKAFYGATHHRCKMSGVLDLTGAQGGNRHRRSHINHLGSNSLLLEELLLLRHKKREKAEISSRQADANSVWVGKLSIGLRANSQKAEYQCSKPSAFSKKYDEHLSRRHDSQLCLAQCPAAFRHHEASDKIQREIHFAGYFAQSFFQFSAICLLCSIISGGTWRNGGRNGPA